MSYQYKQITRYNDEDEAKGTENLEPSTLNLASSLRMSCHRVMTPGYPMFHQQTLLTDRKPDSQMFIGAHH